MNRAYQKGYRWEVRVIKDLQRRGFFIRRAGKSSFPDIIALPPLEHGIILPIRHEKKSYNLEINIPILVECKLLRKYFAKKERIELKKLRKFGDGFVAYKEPHPTDGRKSVIIYELV